MCVQRKNASCQGFLRRKTPIGNGPNIGAKGYLSKLARNNEERETNPYRMKNNPQPFFTWHHVGGRVFGKFKKCFFIHIKMNLSVQPCFVPVITNFCNRLNTSYNHRTNFGFLRRCASCPFPSSCDFVSLCRRLFRFNFSRMKSKIYSLLPARFDQIL